VRKSKIKTRTGKGKGKKVNREEEMQRGTGGRIGMGNEGEMRN